MADLSLPASQQDENMDYQWINLAVRKDPEATGWQPVSPDEISVAFASDNSRFIERDGLRLYKRPIALTNHVRAQEEAVARRAMEIAKPLVSRPITTPTGPYPTPRSLRGTLVFLGVWLRAVLKRPESPWLVQKFFRVGPVALRRFADENNLTVDQYVRHCTRAIREGRGRWPGQLIIATPRLG